MNPVKYSIIIPTYTNFNGFQDCLDSVGKYTNFDQAEVIVVANGAPNGVLNYIEEIRDKYSIPMERIWSVVFEDGIGFPKAINCGIKEASPESEYYVLLNDDCILLPQEKNSWLKILEKPFNSKIPVGVTGPLKKTCPISNREFVLFFCSMISKKNWDQFGPLNEDFSPGGGEDILFCIKAEEEGYVNLQVPSQDQLGFDDKQKVFVSTFPIYHPGGTTVKEIDGFSEHLERVSRKIAEKYGKNIDFGGHSYSDFRKESIEILWEAYPDSNLRILDIGAGAGAYSCLKEKYKNVDAIEIWEPNVFKNRLAMKYDCVYAMDVMNFDFNKYDYDLVILGDILEHLSIEDAQTLIDRMKKAGVKNGLIHVPFQFEQGPIYGNNYEIHKQPDLTADIVSKRYPSFSPIKILNWKGVYFLNDPDLKSNEKEKKLTVTATISTKNRYYDTLPITISSIISQTVKPDEFILFEDGEKLDIRQVSVYENMLHVFDHYGIKWSVIFGEGKGQVLNHQKAIDMAKTDLIWRLDDDVQPEPNVLETLLKNFKDPEVGAAGSLILFPDKSKKTTKLLSEGKIQDVKSGIPHPQWFVYPDDMEPFLVQHLNCSFLFRVEAAKHGYCKELSPVGHREETLFTYEMFKEGWKILVDPRVKTWHYRNPKGGIRSYSDSQMWKNDDDVFEKRIQGIESKSIYENKKKKKKFVFLENGRGDHVEFLMILPELLDKYDHVTISCCFPDIFDEYENDPRVEICSTLETKPYIGNTERYHVYHYMGSRNWTGHIRDAYREIYL